MNAVCILWYIGSLYVILLNYMYVTNVSQNSWKETARKQGEAVCLHVVLEIVTFLLKLKVKFAEASIVIGRPTAYGSLHT